MARDALFKVARSVLKDEKDQSFEEFFDELEKVEQKERESGNTVPPPLDFTVQQPFPDGQGKPYVVPQQEGKYIPPFALPFTLDEIPFEPPAKERIEQVWVALLLIV